MEVICRSLLLAACLSVSYLGAEPQTRASLPGVGTTESAFQKALLALKENRLDAALEDLTAAEAEYPIDARIHSFRGIVLVRLGRNSDAATEYRDAIRIDPRMQDAYKNLGFLDWMEHRLDDARKELERAVELSPHDSFAHYYLGRVLLDAHLYAEAFGELKLSGVEWPSEPEFLIAAATGYLSLRQQDDARLTLDRLAKLPLSAVQSVHVASLLILVHQDDLAVNLIQKLAPQGDGGAPAWGRFDMALVNLMAGKYREAIDQAHPLTDVTGPARSDSKVDQVESAPAWSLVGIARGHLGEVESAVIALHRAATLAPTQEEHWLNLSLELMETSRYAEAVAVAREGIVSNPKSYALHLRLGAANLSAGHYDEAERVFRELVDAGDPLPTSYVGLAQVLLRTGRAEEAVSELAAAHKRIGPNFLISYFEGLSLDRTAKRQEAIDAFHAALQQNPGSAEAHLGLGKTELALGQASGAITELEEALALDPNLFQARRLLTQARHRAGEADNSSTTRARHNEAEPESVVAPGDDLSGDFVLPPWQLPPPEPAAQ